MKYLLTIYATLGALALSAQLSIVTHPGNNTPGPSDTVICNSNSATFAVSTTTSQFSNLVWSIQSGPTGATLTPNASNSWVTITWSSSTFQQNIVFKVEDPTVTPVVSKTLELLILATTTLTLSQTSYCKTDPITALGVGLPSSGTFSISPNPTGLLSATGSLDPSKINTPGTYTVTYSITNTYPANTTPSITCISTASQQITIGGTNVSLNLSPSTFQSCNSPISLTGIATPSGGTFSIPGYPSAISGNQLLPSQLPPNTYTLRYTYVDGFGCTTIKDQTITVTGINLTGSNINLFVLDPNNPQPTPISPTLFSGLQTFSICTGASSAFFQIQPYNLSNFTNYTMTWGDGSPASTGTFS